ncbi:hypothetical protein HID58_087853, partial [Brassica napus]
MEKAGKRKLTNQVAHVRSGVRQRVRARSGAGGSILTFCLRFLPCCLFLSKSSSIYSRIWVSDLALGSSPLERRNGSGGDSVSTGFVAVNDTWLSSDSCKFRCAAVKGVVYGSSIAAHAKSVAFGSRRLQVWGDSRLQSLIASVARL